MASFRGRKSKSRRRAKTSGRRQMAAASSVPALPASRGAAWVGTALGAVLFLGGQAALFSGRAAAGLLVSAGGLALLAVALSGRLPAASPLGGLLRRRVSSPPEALLQRPLPPAAPAPAASPFLFTFQGFVRFLLVAAALGCGAKGQMLLSQAGNPATLEPGLRFFAVGALCFAVALWPWRAARLAEAPLSHRVEAACLVLILALAAFLRTWRIDEIPSGIFIDMGFEGYGALKILHEGWRPLHVGETLQAPALLLYCLAGWFAFFEPTQVNLYLFFAFVALLGLPLVYWTFRQLAGPRVALLTVYLLSIMRWHVNFSRNAFPNIQMILYMFGTLAFLLYGLRRGKTWPFLVSAVFFAAGLYTYQAYKAFPILVVLLGLYECGANGRRVWAQKWRIALFAVLSFTLMLPVLSHWKKTGSLGTRENLLSISSEVARAGSWEPALRKWQATALMFHRRGDPNPRHNLQDHRMLDHGTGVLFVLGLAYALSRFWRRENFWALSGLGVMSLPCLLSIDPAHANRMLGVTPFVAFLAAQAAGAVWERARALGRNGEGLFLLLLAPLLAVAGKENFRTYFRDQAGNYASWREYSMEETRVGRAVQESAERFEYFVSPRFRHHYTVYFLSYFQRDHLRQFDQTQDLVPRGVPEGRGALYALEEGKTGVVGALRFLHPAGVHEPFLDPRGQAIVEFFRLPPQAVRAASGLAASYSRLGLPSHAPDFPRGLPEGPWRGEFTGSLWIEGTGIHRFRTTSRGMLALEVAGRPVPDGGTLSLARGWYAVRIVWERRAGDPPPSLAVEEPGGAWVPLDAGRLTPLQANRGLLGTYWQSAALAGAPKRVQWEPVLNFTNGNDFPLQHLPMAIRWEGTLRAPAAGEYAFRARTLDSARVVVDGREVVRWGANGTGTVRLSEGSHRLVVEYRKTGGYWATFNLDWRRPGAFRWEVVPMEAFGTTSSGGF